MIKAFLKTFWVKKINQHFKKMNTAPTEDGRVLMEIRKKKVPSFRPFQGFKFQRNISRPWILKSTNGLRNIFIFQVCWTQSCEEGYFSEEVNLSILLMASHGTRLAISWLRNRADWQDMNWHQKSLHHIALLEDEEKEWVSEVYSPCLCKTNCCKCSSHERM